ncbi:hypothetical protein N7476_008346 [Penicillium atrosanguineum]|uniref:Zn(2)-C6 fungal-type domain-containing protein n=1 Tax=Penicillium atrosanguineum TaxID=1132637 RepID=A0A9W9PTE8_9EURO|nr:hypothetical protein N7476_008346 [Penicillium atrosanguineum]
MSEAMSHNLPEHMSDDRTNLELLLQLGLSQTAISEGPIAKSQSHLSDRTYVKEESASPTSTPKTSRKRHSKHDGDTAEYYSERAREDAHRGREAAAQRANTPESAKRARTRQACDRCKYRRLACDPNPGGCAACSNVDLPCQMTDRVTGETLVRGEVKRLRANFAALLKTVTELREENQRLHGLLQAYFDQCQVGKTNGQINEIDMGLAEPA